MRVGNDGARIEVSATVAPLRNAQGRIVGASKIIRDITERKRAEKALEASQQQLQLFIEHAAAPGLFRDLRRPAP